MHAEDVGIGAQGSCNLLGSVAIEIPKGLAKSLGTRLQQDLCVLQPFTGDAFQTVPLALDDWLICLGLASCVLWLDELKKVVARWLRG